MRIAIGASFASFLAVAFVPTRVEVIDAFFRFLVGVGFLRGAGRDFGAFPEVLEVLRALVDFLDAADRFFACFLRPDFV